MKTYEHTLITGTVKKPRLKGLWKKPKPKISRQVLWDTLKGFLRAQNVSYSVSINKN